MTDQFKITRAGSAIGKERVMSDFSHIRELLEKAEEPSPELDDAIERLLPSPELKLRPGQASGQAWFGPPNYTSSIDAAVALVEQALPGWLIELEKDTDGVWAVALSECRDPFIPPYLAVAQRPALALCIALLKALEARDD